MTHGALVRRNFPQRGGKRLPESALVGRSRGREDREGFTGQLLVVLLPRAAPAEQAYGQVMRQPQQEAPLVAHAVEQRRLFGQLDEQLLEQIARIRLVPGEIEKVCEQI